MGDARGPLQQFKEDQSRQTRAALAMALDRFEGGTLNNLPPGTSLTRATFHTESGVPTETAFSRYPPGHSRQGEYRYPEIVRRFAALREKLRGRSISPSKRKRLEVDEIRERMKELRQTIAEQDAALLRSRRVAIELDSILRGKDKEIVDLKAQIADLEEALAQARRDSLLPLETRRR